MRCSFGQLRISSSYSSYSSHSSIATDGNIAKVYLFGNDDCLFHAELFQKERTFFLQNIDPGIADPAVVLFPGFPLVDPGNSLQW